MGKDKKYLNGEGSSANESSKAILPKPEIFDFEIPITSETTYSRPHGETVLTAERISLAKFGKANAAALAQTVERLFS